MFAEVDDDAILVDQNIERYAATSMENRIELQSLFIGEMVGFYVGRKRIGSVGVIVPIDSFS